MAILLHQAQHRGVSDLVGFHAASSSKLSKLASLETCQVWLCTLGPGNPLEIVHGHTAICHSPRLKFRFLHWHRNIMENLQLSKYSR